MSLVPIPDHSVGVPEGRWDVAPFHDTDLFQHFSLHEVTGLHHGVGHYQVGGVRGVANVIPFSLFSSSSYSSSSSSYRSGGGSYWNSGYHQEPSNPGLCGLSNLGQ